MLKTLLLCIFVCLFSLPMMAQGDCAGCLEDNLKPQNTAYAASDAQATPTFSIYPNPAADYITIKDASNVITHIYVYNLVGRKIKSFAKKNNDTYYVSDLSKGLYLVQMQGTNGQVLTTQRLHKR